MFPFAFLNFRHSFTHSVPVSYKPTMCRSLGWVLKILVNQEGRFGCCWGLDTLEGTDKIRANTRTYYIITNCVSPLEETKSFAYYSLNDTKVSFSPSPWHLRFFWDREMKINGHGTVSVGRNGLLRLCIKTRAFIKELIHVLQQSSELSVIISILQMSTQRSRGQVTFPRSHGLLRKLDLNLGLFDLGWL